MRQKLLALGAVLLASVSYLAADGAGVVSFVADVEIYSDSPDRVWALVDRDGDRLPEDAWAFTSRHDSIGSDVLSELPRSIVGALVVAGPRYLSVTETDDGQTRLAVTMMLSGKSTETSAVLHERGATRVLLGEGAALTRRTVPRGSTGTELTGSEAREWLAGLSTVSKASGSPLADYCPAECGDGGEGASSCGSGCSLGLSAGGNMSFIGSGGGAQAGVQSSDNCNVSCNEGFFACCNCAVRTYSMSAVTIALANANCQCHSSDCWNNGR